MSTLSERLRLQPEDEGGPSRMEMLRERREAADELDRLTARVAELEKSLRGLIEAAIETNPDAMKAARAALEAEHG